MKIKHEKLRGDSLSPLIFVSVMIPLTLVLRQTKISYEVIKGGKKIEFGFKKCGVLILKKRKVVKSREVSMLNGNMMKNNEECGYMYLGMLETDGVKHEEMRG